MSKMIIKAQRAISGANTVLIYNQDQSVSGELPYIGAIKNAIGDRDKAYFEATIDDFGVVNLHREVRKQKW